MVDGLLGPSDITEIHGLMRAGLQTALDLQDPPVTATIRTWNESTGTYDLVMDGAVPATYRVDVTYAGGMADTGVTLSESAAGGGIMGEVEAFAPFPIMVGDRLTLSTGAILVISPPAPSTDAGIVTGRWQSEEGAR